MRAGFVGSVQNQQPPPPTAVLVTSDAQKAGNGKFVVK
jgi:hypothetical protein